MFDVVQPHFWPVFAPFHFELAMVFRDACGIKHFDAFERKEQSIKFESYFHLLEMFNEDLIKNDHIWTRRSVHPLRQCNGAYLRSGYGKIYRIELQSDLPFTHQLLFETPI